MTKWLNLIIVHPKHDSVTPINQFDTIAYHATLIDITLNKFEKIITSITYTIWCLKSSPLGPQLQNTSKWSIWGYPGLPNNAEMVGFKYRVIQTCPQGLKQNHSNRSG